MNEVLCGCYTSNKKGSSFLKRFINKSTRPRRDTLGRNMLGRDFRIQEMRERVIYRDVESENGRRVQVIHRVASYSAIKKRMNVF